MGTHPQQASVITNFVVVEALSVYNIILGRLTLNQARAVVSTYSLVFKFLTPQGVGILRGDQAIARRCYVTSLPKNTGVEALNVEEIDPSGENKGMSPVEELTQIVLDPLEPDQVISVGSLLEIDLQTELARFFQ